MFSNRSPWLVTAAVLVSLLGCGRSAPPSKPQVPADPKTESPQVAKRDAKDVGTESSTEAKPSPSIDEDSAAAAILRTLQALEAGDLAKAYDFLPPAYQSDIDGLVHEFASRMDADIWAKLVATTRKSIELLRTKKDRILALDLFERPEAEPYRKHWDSTLDLLNTLVNSEAASLSKLKQLEVKTLLPGKASPAPQQLDAIQRALGANLAHQFVGVTVTPVRTAGDEQIVALRGPNDEKPIEIAYVKHDGRWLPKSLVEQWPNGIAADRDWLTKLPARIQVVKPKVMDALAQADAMLDQLLAASNREEFEQAAGPAVLSLATAWPNLQRLAQQAMSGQSEAPPVTVSINRELTESELSRLVDSVLKPLREAGSDYTLLANDGRTTCRLLRVADVDGLRKTLVQHFGLPAEAIQLDGDSATLRVNLGL